MGFFSKVKSGLKKIGSAIRGGVSQFINLVKEYQDKVVATIGQKKEEKIRDEIAQDKLDGVPVEGREIIITGKGIPRI